MKKISEQEILFQRVGELLEDATPEEVNVIKDYFQNEYGKENEEMTLYGFFAKIFGSETTTKSAFLNEAELYNLRIYLNMALYSKRMNLNFVSLYLTKKAEIIASSSLSKDGFFVNALVTKKSELKAKNLSEKEERGNAGWFKKKTD